MTTSPLAPLEKVTMHTISGVALAAYAAGVRYQGRTDVLLAVMDEGTQVAGVYTRSLTASAPVEWCRQGAAQARALVVNSGNSNAFTGKAGVDSVTATAKAAAALIGCAPEEVYIASTGVIGVPLPHEKIIDALPAMQSQASEEAWDKAAAAIMTTDTFAKMSVATATIGDVKVNINGIAKGSGMIAPDMATMLAFIFTDAAIDSAILKTLLVRANHKTFNSITVDSDTSTSDTALLFATGKAGNPQPEDAGDPMLDDFKRALYEVMEDLAKQIVCDGEGASKLVTIHVSGAEDDEAARRIGLAIGNSPLIKTMVAGEDPNWGRLVMAVGKSGEWADRDRLVIHIGDVQVTENGMVHPDYKEADGAAHMKESEITFSVDVGVGVGRATVWTCDLTDGYIRINADYRS